MALICVQQSGSKHAVLFPTADTANMEFVFPEEKQVLKSFKAKKTGNGDDADERNIHLKNLTRRYAFYGEFPIERNSRIFAEISSPVQLLVYLIAYPLLWGISILPFRLLYVVSDIVYVLLYHVIGYRKKTVRLNLELAFPDLPVERRREIERKSYQHLCDMFLEMIKTMTISRKEMEKRFQYENLDLYKEMERRGKPIAVVCGHYASYEWVISMNYVIGHKGYAIYKRIANKHFDKLVKKIRMKFDANLITTKETGSTILHNKAAGILSVYGFAMDQSPKIDKAHHWTEFMGIKTPVHTGAEMLAKKFDMNVIFLDVAKVSRGHYLARFEEIADHPVMVPDYEITDEFFRRLEKQIRKAPEYYLWTHKRWKHRA